MDLQGGNRMSDIFKEMEERNIITKAEHYNQGKYEVIDVLEDWGLDKNAYLWNTVKYISRCNHKGNYIQDLKKARYYLDREIARAEGE